MPKFNLALLEEKLKSNDEFASTWEYFMDEFAEKEAFLEAGKRSDHPFLSKVLAAVVGKLTGQRVVLTQIVILELPGQHFLHGSGITGSRVIGFFYFAKSDLGMASFVESMTSDRVSFVRFSATRMDTPGGSSVLTVTE